MMYSEYTSAKRTATPTDRKLLLTKNKLTKLTARAAQSSEVIAPILYGAYPLQQT